MNCRLSFFVALFAFFMGQSLVLAQTTFTASARGGNELKYTVIDTRMNTVSVSAQGTLSGVLVIPRTVKYQGRTYSVTKIGDRAFRGCTGLTFVAIPNTVTTIGNAAFSGCSNMAPTIILPNSITTIGDSVFYNCSGLTFVTIPNSVTFIGVCTFFGCTGLTSVTIPNLVTTIGSGAFSGCSGLTSVTIPNSVTTIGGGAFSGCSGLTSINIPNSVTYIDGGAFMDCTGLTTVTIPNLVTTIGWYAFSGCTGLTFVTIPNSVTSIGGSAFYKCRNLTSVTLGSAVNNIGSSAFTGCDRIRSIHFLSTIPPTIQPTTFVADSTYDYNAYYDFGIIRLTVYNPGVPRNADVVVPCGTLEAYRNASNYNYFTNIRANCDDNGGGVGGVVTLSGSDTTFVPFGDTVYVNITHHYTVNTTIHDTIRTTIQDTLYATINDSVYTTIHDTIITTIHDTLCPEVNSIGSSIVSNMKIYTTGRQIVVEGVEGFSVMLYDMQGRRLMIRRGEGNAPLRFDAPSTGVYMIRIGNMPAQRVTVLR